VKELLKNKKIFYGILLGILFIISISVTYAWFSLQVSGNEEAKQMTVETGTLSLVFKDGVKIEGINVHPGWNQTKTFTVKNTGTFDTSYNIIFKDLVNQIEQNELVVSYTCTSYTGYVDSNNKGTVSGTCNSLTEQVVPLREGALSSTITENISIGVGITHEYTLTLLFKEMDKEQNYNQGKDVNTEINIEESKPWYQACTSSSNNLNCKMITVASALPSSDENIDFAQISSDTNGKGLYYTSDLSLTEDYNGDGTGERVYYYRGAVTNNNVRFGGYCWRIVRTNEDGSVKLRYNGEYENGTCPVTGTDVKINNTSYLFNAEAYNNPKSNEYVFVDGSGESDIKGTVEDWYEDSGLINYEDQIANVPYCADKSNPITPSTGKFTADTFYGAANRLIDYSGTSVTTKSDAQPILKCIDETGKHTASGDAWGGNGKLSHPIGLLTADEVAYAGGVRSSNETYYLYTSNQYWLMSPAGWSPDFGIASSFYVASVGFLGHDNVSSCGHVGCTIGALPAISLRAEVVVSSEGDGSYTNPYVVN